MTFPDTDATSLEDFSGSASEEFGADSFAELGPGPRPTIYQHPIPFERIDPDAVKVIRRLNEAGYLAFLVGGGVRDLLLGRSPKDFDVATSARPEEVRRLFRNCRIIGRRFRLAHIMYGQKIIEVATFRRDPTEALELAENEFAEELAAAAEGATADLQNDDVQEEVTSEQDEQDAQDVQDAQDAENAENARARSSKRREGADLLIRHDNVFGEPHEDAIRRDFTINGLFYDIERERVIDYIGGMPDLERRVMRTIGDPVVRFREDPIRMLRAIKFSARCDFGIDADMMDALVAERDEIKKSAAPRVLEEILRLMRGGAAHRSLYLSWDTGILSVMMPELSSYLDDRAPDFDAFWQRLDVIDRLTTEHGPLPDTTLLLALLWGPLSERVEGERDVLRAFDSFWLPLTRRISVPRRMKDRMRLIFAAQSRLASNRAGNLSKRDFYAEAVFFCGIQREALGEAIAEMPSKSALATPRERERHGHGGGGDRPPRDDGRRRRRRR